MKAGEARGADTELLVKVWTLLRDGNQDVARQTLIYTWCNFMDGLTGQQAGRVAIGLFERLGFCTDDLETWSRLPDPIPIFRAGQPGISWSTEREVVDELAEEYGLFPITTGAVAKRDVLAYLTMRGEYEIIVRSPDLGSMMGSE